MSASPPVSFTTCDKLGIAYCCGFAEQLREAANADGNLALFGLAQKVICLRNFVYLEGCLLAGGLIGYSLQGSKLFMIPVIAGAWGLAYDCIKLEPYQAAAELTSTIEASQSFAAETQAALEDRFSVVTVSTEEKEQTNTNPSMQAIPQEDDSLFYV